MICRLLILTTLSLFSLVGCARVENPNSNLQFTNSSSPTPTVAKETKPAEDAKVDAALQNIASEFRRRLVYYNGKLLSLTLNDRRIVAEWNSQRCDWAREEIIDLAISINRGYSGSVSAIEIKRICDSTTKNFSISGAKFNQYKSGQIGDPQFLEGIK